LGTGLPFLLRSHIIPFLGRIAGAVGHLLGVRHMVVIKEGLQWEPIS